MDRYYDTPRILNFIDLPHMDALVYNNIIYIASILVLHIDLLYLYMRFLISRFRIIPIIKIY